MSRPAQSSGSVIASGRSCVSRSMNVSATMHHTKSIAPNACQPNPNRQAAYAVSAAVAASTTG